jgi:hypothetical protein
LPQNIKTFIASDVKLNGNRSEVIIKGIAKFGIVK